MKGSSTGARTGLRAAFVLAVLIAAALLLTRQGAAIGDALHRFDRGAALLTLAAAAGHVLFSYWAWRLLTPGGARALTGPQARTLFFLSQAGKYLPGGVWQFVAAGELGRELGLARRETMASFVFALLAAIAAGAALTIFALADRLGASGLAPLWFVAALLPLAVLLYPPAMRLVARVTGLERVPGPLPLLGSALLALGTWAMGGAMLGALASALGYGELGAGIVTYAAWYAAAWIGGFLVLIAPAGIGAREGILIAFLSSQMPVAEASLIALTARVAVTLVDLGAAGLILAVSRLPASR